MKKKPPPKAPKQTQFREESFRAAQVLTPELKKKIAEYRRASYEAEYSIVKSRGW